MKISAAAQWLALAVLACVPALSQSQPQQLGELFAVESGPQGAPLPVGTGIAIFSGSELTAGKLPAAFKLARGGQVRICPRTGLTVSGGPAGQGLMFALNSGAIEVNYPMDTMADTLLTPDFRIMLAGPGTFHFALGINGRGDSCIRSLRGNNSSIIISENMGQGMYQLKPDEAVLFAGGKLADKKELTETCGCPAPLPVSIASSAQHEKDNGPRAAMSASLEPLPAEQPGQVHVQVDTPFVFHARTSSEGRPLPAINRPVSSLPNVDLPQEIPRPVVLKVKAGHEKRRGLLGRIRGFFAALFRG